jgi:hypothetical protein
LTPVMSVILSFLAAELPPLAVPAKELITALARCVPVVI